jgi:hypothetical protein
MRTILSVFALAGTLLAADAAPKAAPPPRNLLTNEGVLLLAEAGLGERFLLELIESKTSRFDTSAEALAALARHGLTENILRALVKKQDQPLAAAQSAENSVALEPHLLRGKIVRQRMLVPDSAGGNVAIMTMAPVKAAPTIPAAAPAAPKDANADRWYLITQR